MKIKNITVIVFLVFFFCALNQSEAGGVDKEKVQGVMKDYIDEKTANGDGTYYIKGVGVEFDYIHEGVDKKWGGIYVSCADFKAGSDVYDIDYYVKAEDGSLTVVKEVLHKLNKKNVNEVLWQIE